MLLSCPDRGEKPRLRAQPVCWGRWQAPDFHDVAWRILFAALRISVEYMVEHIFLYGDDVGCDNFQKRRQCLCCGILDVQFEVRAARSCHCDNSDRGHNLHSPAICGAYRAAAVYLIHQLPLAAAAPAFDLARHPASRALSTDGVTSWRETSPVSATVEWPGR
jgi:hypothetical protein